MSVFQHPPQPPPTTPWTIHEYLTFVSAWGVENLTQKAFLGVENLDFAWVGKGFWNLSGGDMEFEPEVTSIHCFSRVVMDAYMSGNQSGAEKDNRLLFEEQWMLLFSKSKMAATNFSQSGAELRIQDGGAHVTKVGHVGKQPTSLDGGLGSVSRISMTTQITPGSRKNCHATSKSILTVSCGPKRQRSVRQVARLRDLGATAA